MERYIITWRPFGVRVVVAAVGLLPALVCLPGTGGRGGVDKWIELASILGAGMFVGAIFVPGMRDSDRDLTRATARPGTWWWVAVAGIAVLLAVASQVRVLNWTDAQPRVLWGVAIAALTTGLAMPVRTPRKRRVPRRADGVALRCTNCGYDMEGVPGAVCPECGEDCKQDAPVAGVE
jgi:hypothetical protein